jgi:hypothetical protein
MYLPTIRHVNLQFKYVLVAAAANSRFKGNYITSNTMCRYKDQRILKQILIMQAVKTAVT